MDSRSDDWVYWYFFTITLNYSSSHIELLLDNESLTVSPLVLGLVSSLVPLSTTESWTQLTSCGPNIDDRPQRFHYCVSRMRRFGNPCIHLQAAVSFRSLYKLLPGDDMFAAFCCNGRGDGNVAEQRTSPPCFYDCTLPAFRRHVTIFNEMMIIK
jgi:hypothetical protein